MQQIDKGFAARLDGVRGADNGSETKRTLSANGCGDVAASNVVNEH
jgi:hypothetical protein